jgi:hypothetical protein
MLRTNLATRPFYNERAAHVVIALAAVVVLGITVFNLMRIVSLSRHNTELSTRVGAEQAEARRLTAEAAKIRATMNKDELELVVGAADEANTLIDQRTFSWTRFFNVIESTLPPDVMLSAVRPSIKDGATHVSMSVLGRGAEPIDEFMERLEATGAFEQVVPASKDRTDAGLHRVLIESTYVASSGEAEPETEPAALAQPAAAGGRR